MDPGLPILPAERDGAGFPTRLRDRRPCPTHASVGVGFRPRAPLTMNPEFGLRSCRYVPNIMRTWSDDSDNVSRGGFARGQPALNSFMRKGIAIVVESM